MKLICAICFLLLFNASDCLRATEDSWKPFVEKTEVPALDSVHFRIGWKENTGDLSMVLGRKGKNKEWGIDSFDILGPTPTKEKYHLVLKFADDDKLVMIEFWADKVLKAVVTIDKSANYVIDKRT